MPPARGPSPLSIAWLALALALTLGASGVACGGSAQTKPCPDGTERCACYGNGTCNAGLQCLSNLCVTGTGAAGTTGASGATGAAGTTGASGATGAAGTTGASGATGAAGTSGATGSGGTMGAGGSGSGGAMSSGGSSGTGGTASGGSSGTGSGGRGGSAGTGSGGNAAGTGGRGGSSGNAGTSGNGGTSGNAGSGGSAGSSGSGGAAGSGAAGAGGTGSCGDLIDDMEAGTGFICQGNGRVGYWYTYIDTSGFSSITPPASQVPSKPVAFSPTRNFDSSTRAMHASGVFTYYAGIGFLINAPVIDAPWSTFDASGYTGIEFWVKGTPYLRVLLHTPATVATQYHGTCTTSVCMGAVSPNYFISPNVWVLIDLPFASLTSGTAPFDPAQLSAIEFQPNTVGAFDLWIDDVRFY